MMRLVGRSLASLAFLLLAAHFLRSGSILLAPCVLLAGLAWIAHRGLQRVVQVGLALGALEWLRTLMALAAVRQAMGQPWHRMAGILGTVIAVTLMAAWLLTPERPSEAVDRTL